MIFECYMYMHIQKTAFCIMGLVRYGMHIPQNPTNTNVAMNMSNYFDPWTIYVYSTAVMGYHFSVR